MRARAGATTGSFWAERPPKSGVAPARFGLFCAVTFAEVVVARGLRTNSVGRASGEEVGTDEGADRNSYVLHLSHLLPLPVSSRIRRRRRAKHREESRGLERPQTLVWTRNRVQKWGRSSPTRCFARVQVDRRSILNALSFGHLLGRQD